MTEYHVTIVEHLVHGMHVRAENKEQAERIARDTFPELVGTDAVRLLSSEVSDVTPEELPNMVAEVREADIV